MLRTRNKKKNYEKDFYNRKEFVRIEVINYARKRKNAKWFWWRPWRGLCMSKMWHKDNSSKRSSLL
jgi:hypothetical protein